jgi:hypothetical protein
MIQTNGGTDEDVHIGASPTSICHRGAQIERLRGGERRGDVAVVATTQIVGAARGSFKRRYCREAVFYRLAI